MPEVGSRAQAGEIAGLYLQSEPNKQRHQARKGSEHENVNHSGRYNHSRINRIKPLNWVE